MEEGVGMMAGKAAPFSGSQDILFPEDAPTHYDSTDSVYYSPPGNSSYSSYTQEAKCMFPPEERFQSSLEYLDHSNEFRPSPNSGRMDRARRRSLQTVPPRDSYNVREKEPPRLTLSPLSRSVDLESSLDSLAGLKGPAYKDSNQNNGQHANQYKRSQRYDSRSSSRSGKSPRSAGTPDIDVKQGLDSPKHVLGGDNLLYRAIPEQEIYTTLQNKLLPPKENRPSIKPPPNWCKLYGNGQEGLLIASRRKTWSPPTGSQTLSCVNNFHALRCYRSNEQLDCKEELCPISGEPESVYEDIDSVVGPPQITPVSGILNKNSQKLLIKPVAFKPVMTPSSSRFNALSPIQHSATLPTSLTSPRRAIDPKLAAGHSHDDGYASQEYSSGSHSHSTSNTSSQNSSYQVSDCDRSMSHEGGKSLDHSGSGAGLITGVGVSRLSSNTSSSHHQGEGHHQTPSPSDSGVGEIESIMRDKDAEIQHLRETMEHNETVIFQVYEEKRQNWGVQLKDVVSEWERRLQHHQEKTSKMEQALLLQLFKLQQERNSLRLEMEQLRSENSQLISKLTESESEKKESRCNLEEQQWETAQKAGEVSLLKAQLKEAKDLAAARNGDLICVKTKLKDLEDVKSAQSRETQFFKDEVKRLTEETLTSRSELEKLRRLMGRPKSDKHVQTEESRLHSHGASSSQNTGASSSPNLASFKVDTAEVVDDELSQTKVQLLALQERYEREKEQWLIEKDKVINYQKHLQLNYVQMFRKNKMLELEMEQLMVELENKDLTLSERLGSEASDGFESTC